MERVRFDPVKAFSFEVFTSWAAKALAPGATVTSDGLLGFEVLRRLSFTHRSILGGKGKAGCEVEPFKWLNTLLGNLKTALSGTHHAFAFRKYGHGYLAEVQYRFNRRFDLAAMVPRLTVALMHATPCPRDRILALAEVSIYLGNLFSQGNKWPLLSKLPPCRCKPGATRRPFQCAVNSL